MKWLLVLVILASAAFLDTSATARADAVDDRVKALLTQRGIPGASLAIIEGGRIVKAQGYGVIEQGGDQPVTADTLFQAGSISKPVTAIAALRMVEQGQLALDDDVNGKLASWKLPDSPLTAEEKVTLRRILSHTAGLTVHGFPGYAAGEPRPTMVQILDGEKPANTPAIRVDQTPGSMWRYSGGGYTILQLMMTDVAAKPFPELMDDSVLRPLGMTASSFAQPLPDSRAALTATGHRQDRAPVPGRWHIYPEMAAAGLWTTPSDLARLAIGVQRSLAGQPGGVLSASTTREMLTRVKNDVGLGFFLTGSGKNLRFYHNGRDEGFDAQLLAYATTGQGAVIMINANDDPGIGAEVLQAIATEYNWPDYPVFEFTAEAKPAAIAPGETTDIAVTVKNAGTATSGCQVLVDVKDASGAEVFKKTAAHQAFSEGQSRTYRYEWTATTPGEFTVNAGVFETSWTTMYGWGAAAATITVK